MNAKQSLIEKSMNQKPILLSVTHLVLIQRKQNASQYLYDGESRLDTHEMDTSLLKVLLLQ